MNREEQEPIVRRILVALDASAHSLAVLEVAARMAAAQGAELIGLFVEDIDLLRLAGSPVGREVGYASATGRSVDTPGTERSLRAVAAQARRALSAAAERTQVRWSFRVTRGSVVSELLEAALEADLVALGRMSRARRPVGLGATARAFIAQVPRPVLLLHAGAEIHGPVMVVYDGSVASRRALDAAAALDQSRDGLVVLTLTDDAETARRLEREVSERLKARGLKIVYHKAAKSVAHVLRAAQHEHAGALVLSVGASLFQGEALEELIARLECAVFLVR